MSDAIQIQMEGSIFVIERTPSDAVDVRHRLASLGLFRKGPFRIDGVDVPSHWNADAKWRVLSTILHRPEFREILEGPSLRLADVGANNGYYLFRLLHDLKEPLESGGARREFLAVDPVEEFERQFDFLHSFLPGWPVSFSRTGWQDLPSFAPFHLILCMGVLYHHTDPVEVLRSLHQSLAPGGRLILETMILPTRGDGLPLALIPPGRYAGARGIWIVPDAEALQIYFRRTGWRNIRLEHVRDARDEQIRYGEFPAFREMLDPADETRTIEGYPAPLRAFVSAQK